MTQSLTRRLIVAGAATLLLATAAPVHAQDVLTSNAVTGAGSTFAYPVLSRWANAYKRWVA